MVTVCPTNMHMYYKPWPNRQEHNYIYMWCYKAQQQRSQSADAWSLRCSLGTASNHWVTHYRPNMLIHVQKHHR